MRQAEYYSEGVMREISKKTKLAEYKTDMNILREEFGVELEIRT